MSTKQRKRIEKRDQAFSAAVRVCVCLRSLSLSVMVQINICTSSPDNGDMVLVSHLEDMKNTNCLRKEKAPTLGKRCQIFFFF